MPTRKDPSGLGEFRCVEIQASEKPTPRYQIVSLTANQCVASSTSAGPSQVLCFGSNLSPTRSLPALSLYSAVAMRSEAE